MFSASVSCRAQAVMNTWVGAWPSERRSQPVGVGEVGQHGSHPGQVDGGTAGEPQHAPAVLLELVAESATGDAGGSHDEGGRW